MTNSSAKRLIQTVRRSGVPRNLFGGGGFRKEFFRGGGGGQIQLGTEGREHGDLGDRATGRIMLMKNSNDTIGNRSRDLPVCSAVPQPLRHRVPQSK
jgi:hypothetical protein